MNQPPSKIELVRMHTNGAREYVKKASLDAVLVGRLLVDRTVRTQAGTVHLVKEVRMTPTGNVLAYGIPKDSRHKRNRLIGPVSSIVEIVE